MNNCFGCAGSWMGLIRSSHPISTEHCTWVQSYQSRLFFKRNQKTGFEGGAARAFMKLLLTRNVLRSWATYCGPVLFLCQVQLLHLFKHHVACWGTRVVFGRMKDPSGGFFAHGH